MSRKRKPREDEKCRQEMLDPFSIVPEYEARAIAHSFIKRYSGALAALSLEERCEHLRPLAEAFRALDAQFPVAKRNWWQRIVAAFNAYPKEKS